MIQALRLAQQGAVFAISHSGGKDSQAMYLYLTQDLQIPHEKIIVVHADLGAVDWEGSIEHINATIEHNLHVVRNPNKEFMSMVEKRGKFPSSQHRQCTSDLKRDPISTFIRRRSNETGCKLIIDCQGIRAEESPARARKDPFKLNKRECKAGREWWVWYPIFDKSTEWVFNRIEEAGQKPRA